MRASTQAFLDERRDLMHVAGDARRTQQKRHRVPSRNGVPPDCGDRGVGREPQREVAPT